ncbi:hypothetical protein B8X02_11860 [Stenotrophomonas rhizophila]|nr:hypothetical protein B8X02_11860 [Stenotrophomonas rhizophila]
MLPPDFHWPSVASRPDGKDDGVFCDGTQVLRLSERINGGGWFADLTPSGQSGSAGRPELAPATTKASAEQSCGWSVTKTGCGRR